MSETAKIEAESAEELLRCWKITLSLYLALRKVRSRSRCIRGVRDSQVHMIPMAEAESKWISIWERDHGDGICWFQEGII